MKRNCTECGAEFNEKGNYFICRDCRKMIYNSLHLQFELEPEEEKLDYKPIYPLHKGDTQLDLDCREADRLRVSYGRYKADQLSEMARLKKQVNRK